MSSITTNKALALLRERRVHKLEEPGAFDVDGTTGKYRVQLGQTLHAPDTCTCKAAEFGAKCSHIKAAKLWLSRHRSEEKTDA